MMQIDRKEEQEAIELYGKIIEASRTAQDEITTKMFQRILSDEEKHFREFSRYLMQD